MMELSTDTAKQLVALSKHLHKTPENLIEELVDIEYYRVFIIPTIDEYSKGAHKNEVES